METKVSSSQVDNCVGARNNSKSPTNKNKDTIDSCLLEYYNKCCDQYGGSSERKRIVYSSQDLLLIKRNTPKDVSETFINSIGDKIEILKKSNSNANFPLLKEDYNNNSVPNWKSVNPFKVDNRYKWTNKNEKFIDDKKGNSVKILSNTVKEVKTQEDINDVANGLENLKVFENSSSFNADELSKLGANFKNSNMKFNKVLDDNRLAEGTKNELKEENFLISSLKHGEWSKEEIKNQKIEKISKGHKIKEINDEKMNLINKSGCDGQKLQESLNKHNKKPLPLKNIKCKDDEDEVTDDEDDDETSSCDESSTSLASISVAKIPLPSGQPPKPKTRTSLSTNQPSQHLKTEQKFLSNFFKNIPPPLALKDLNTQNTLIDITLPHTTSDQATLNFYWESYQLHTKQAQFYKECYEKAVTANKTNELVVHYNDYIKKLVQSQREAGIEF